MEIPRTRKLTKKEQIEEYRNNIPNLHNGSYRRTYDKAINRISMRSAVNAKCLDCTCWQSTEIKHCPIPACPLYPYRPYQKGSDDLYDGSSARQSTHQGASGKTKHKIHTLAGVKENKNVEGQ